MKLPITATLMFMSTSGLMPTTQTKNPSKIIQDGNIDIISATQTEATVKLFPER